MKEKEFKEQVISMSERLYPMVSRMLQNEEGTKDAIQEVMIKLWGRRKQIKNHPNIPGLVFLTARNHCLDQIKKRSIPMDSTNYSVLQVHTSHHDPLEYQELHSIIESLIKELPEQQSEILTLRDIDGLEYLEIAGITDLNVEHIRVLASRARKTIVKKLKNIYSYE